MKDWVKVFNYRARADRRSAEERDAEIIKSDDEDDSNLGKASTKLSSLWDLVVKPVLEKLGMLHGINHLKELPRIWWVGGGIMSLMPLHAAGDFSTGSTENTLSHAICSYIPTLKMLQFLRGKQSSPISSGIPKLLIVSMPTTPGGYRLLYTAKEADAIIKRSGSSAQVLHLTCPSKRTVIESLPSCLLAHFACHGKVDFAAPGESSLILGQNIEERLTVDEMLDVIKHIGGQLAYLSACSTAEIDAGDLIHESIHLASAFQLAGFQQAIGTLWRADDSTAVYFAGKFYELLFQEREITGKSVVNALHAAVIHCRDTASNLKYWLKWAPFVHLRT
jgi:CHAT domain-containing protein